MLKNDINSDSERTISLQGKRMADALTSFLRDTLPPELQDLVSAHIDQLENGRYEELLFSEKLKPLVHYEAIAEDRDRDAGAKWQDKIFERLGIAIAKCGSHKVAAFQHFLLLAAFASLQAFLQSNVTGPPLSFDPAELIFGTSDPQHVKVLRTGIIKSLGIDGEAVYKLTPNIELFALADVILTSPSIKKNVKAWPWVKLRVDFIHQRLLSETSPILQTSIYEGLAIVDQLLVQHAGDYAPTYRHNLLLEKATIETYHGFDKKARQDLDEVTKQRHFAYALTGLLGKRTKFQQTDITQLVVFARSNDDSSNDVGSKPNNLNLDDDTLLERLAFTKDSVSGADYKDRENLPPSLASLDPSDQPLLDPLDSINLLLLASSITNTSPVDGLTREETLPYAVRVLEGGSSNWQVYTQALLVRSRIEGYRSRTIERGLLQLQAVVDQVIADTTQSTNGTTDTSTTFLPRPKETESASVQERLRYVYQLCSPTRWELEAELAQRWVSLGGLRTALEIYERLEMWAEAALCWAAVEREDKAKLIVRRQLFYSSDVDDSAAQLDTEKWAGAERSPPPADAPRLYCILGDIDKDPTLYTKAWEVSGRRYARAQRSLGRFYFSSKDYINTVNAYTAALSANSLSGSSWFALGCAQLELSHFEEAAEAFSRTVSLDDHDAEAWSNLAAALLRKGTVLAPQEKILQLDDEEDSGPQRIQDPQQHLKDAFKALKRAAGLKYDSFRIWDNMLTVAASLDPPAYGDMVTAQRRIIEMRGKTDKEKCVDVDILDILIRHIIITTEPSESGVDGGLSARGIQRMVLDLVDHAVTPLITSSTRLWRMVATLALWRGRASSALSAHEKAWRAATSQPGWETSTEVQWDGVVDATIELVDAYESLGPRDRTEGLGAGSGELVAKDWRFKARSVIRGVMGRGKESWEHSSGWERLMNSSDGLKGPAKE